ncbi:MULTISPECIES: tail fiber assembly protein [unclassified Gilliamella]|uniref:tail fiber assembly protein n=1 Tax=unclassified Gilliamella TaxID=2685620 RepID=UPI00226A1379|nr:MULTISPECIES: tail fiber assembly protein [unclassified Gilliamella]MCX8583462.1 tail fiber assembly protein [Gilliamella sp. B3372]MCX8594074.1 tail fiber assembly protein [Gilliamella sp. B3367]
MINYYYDNTNDLKPFTHQLEANDDTLPPDNALRIAPTFKEGYCPCEQEGKWILIEDNREKNAYNIETKETVKIDYLGPIKSGFTLLEPFDFCKWNGEKWALDEEQKNAFFIKQQQINIADLLSEANNEIDILNDKIELEIATDEDKKLLRKWKLYRIQLKSIDINKLDIELPVKPD